MRYYEYEKRFDCLRIKCDSKVSSYRFYNISLND